MQEFNKDYAITGLGLKEAGAEWTRWVYDLLLLNLVMKIKLVCDDIRAMIVSYN